MPSLGEAPSGGASPCLLLSGPALRATDKSEQL